MTTMTYDEMIEVIQAVKDGKRVEFRPQYNGSGRPWTTLDRAGFKDFSFNNFEYRVAQPRKPSINWVHVSDKYNWLCVNDFGLGLLFMTKPQLTKVEWISSSTAAHTYHFASFDRGECDWKDSLVCRPGIVDKDFINAN